MQQRIKISSLPVTEDLDLNDIIPYTDNPSSNSITRKTTFDKIGQLFSEGYFARIVSSRSQLPSYEAFDGAAILVTGAEDAGIFRAIRTEDTPDNSTTYSSATSGFLWSLSLVESKTVISDNSSEFYTFQQGTPSSTWTITHNLGRIPPSVAIVDSVGNLVIGDVIYINNNKLTVTFDSPFSGKAYID